jgi:protein-disulfide isomerase
LDRAGIESAVDNPQVNDTLRENVQLGAQLGLRGTPSYVLGDEVLAGAVRIEALQERISGIRSDGCAAC